MKLECETTKDFTVNNLASETLPNSPKFQQPKEYFFYKKKKLCKKEKKKMLVINLNVPFFSQKVFFALKNLIPIFGYFFFVICK